MKGTIVEIDPLGCEVGEAIEFEFPVIKEIEYGLLEMPDGRVFRTEPAKQVRCLLTIGEFRYIMFPWGKIELVE